jgi:microcystin-dependent protein
MAVNLSPIGNGFQFFTILGQPLAGGKIYTYQAGSSTPLATYTDNTGATANANPIVLGTDGRPTSEVWLTYGFNYKFILKTADDTTIQTYDNLYGIIGTQPATGATIPAGLISMWSGSIGSIPSGWLLCNGSSGTPDLRDRFVVGAGSTYAVAATGGTADAVVVSHTHTASTIATDSGHTHSSNANGAPNGGGAGSAMTNSGNSPGYATTTGNANITASTTVNSAGVSGTNQNLPPYYALAYIQKA